MNYRLLKHVTLFPLVARFRTKAEIKAARLPDTSQVRILPVDFRLYGIWYCVFGTVGLRMKDGSEVPMHVMRPVEGPPIIGPRDLTAADGTPLQDAWRESYADSINTRLQLSSVR